MNNLKRFTMDFSDDFEEAYMGQCEDGEYVKYTDAVSVIISLQKRIEALLTENERVHTMMGASERERRDYRLKYEQLKKEAEQKHH